MSPRHKREKDGAGHTARTHTPAPGSLSTVLEEDRRMEEKSTHKII